MTQSERKSNRFTSITRGLIILFLVQVFLGVLTVLLALLLSSYLDSSPQGLLANRFFNTYVSLYTSLIMTMVTILFSISVENRSLASLGLRKSNFPAPILHGCLLGIALVLIVFLFNFIFQSITLSFQTNQHFIHFILLFFGYILLAISEEVFYRGYLMNALSVEGDIRQAMVINSLLYGIVSAVTTQFSVLHFINSFLLSMLLSYVFYLSDNLLTSIFTNATWLILLNIILGTPTHGDFVPYSLFFVASSAVTSGQINMSQTLYSTFILGLALFGIHLYAKVKQIDTKS